MNYYNFLKQYNVSIENSFEFLYKHFLPTLATYDYLVDWNKVIENKFKYEVQINILNSLLNLSEEEFKKRFFQILKKYPEVIETFPILLATRERRLIFIDNIFNLNINRYIFIKPNLIDNKLIEKYYDFFIKTKLKDLFCNFKITNLIDYVFGVEVGLNSNARKNRTGKLMEKIVSNYLEDFCKNNPNFSFIQQATQQKIYENFKITIQLDKNNRRFDFALFNNLNKNLYLIEVNFYTGGGSKLKATAGEYQYLNDFLKNQKIKFIWITDGKGWLSALNPLEETFIHNDYVINLFMLKLGILDYICH
jgi:type II restriction enzyme